LSIGNTYEWYRIYAKTQESLNNYFLNIGGIDDTAKRDMLANVSAILFSMYGELCNLQVSMDAGSGGMPPLHDEAHEGVSSTSQRAIHDVILALMQMDMADVDECYKYIMTMRSNKE